MTIGRIGAGVFLAALYLFLFAPMLVVAGASLGGGDRPYVRFPPETWSLEWYRRMPAGYLDSLRISALLALATAAVAILLAVPAALALVRGRFPGRRLAGLMLRAPLQIPYVVTGIAFLQTYYLVGGAIGLNLRGHFVGLLLGHVFLATPYAVGALVAVLERFPPRLEEAAQGLGASGWRVFRRVTVPLIAPGIYAGGLYAFIVSFGEVPVALFLGGPGVTTFPVQIFAAMQFDFSPSLLAISTLTLVVSLVLLLALQRLIGIDTLLRAGGGRR